MKSASRLVAHKGIIAETFCVGILSHPFYVLFITCIVAPGVHLSPLDAFGSSSLTPFCCSPPSFVLPEARQLRDRSLQIPDFARHGQTLAKRFLPAVVNSTSQCLLCGQIALLSSYLRSFILIYISLVSLIRFSFSILASIFIVYIRCILSLMAHPDGGDTCS